MFERIIEIIVFVISELKQNKAIADISIDELHDLGYTSAEISTAFSWIVDRIDFSERFLPGTTTPSPKSFRILHADEKDLFTTDGWGEIIHLQSLGIINNSNIEQIIERALMMGMKEIDSSQIKEYIAHFIFNAIPPYPSTIRVMLNGSEKVN